MDKATEPERLPRTYMHMGKCRSGLVCVSLPPRAMLFFTSVSQPDWMTSMCTNASLSMHTCINTESHWRKCLQAHKQASPCMDTQTNAECPKHLLFLRILTSVSTHMQARTLSIGRRTSTVTSQIFVAAALNVCATPVTAQDRHPLRSKRPRRQHSGIRHDVPQANTTQKRPQMNGPS